MHRALARFQLLIITSFFDRYGRGSPDDSVRTRYCARGGPMVFLLPTALGLPLSTLSSAPGAAGRAPSVSPDRDVAAPTTQILNGFRADLYDAAVALAVPGAGSFCTASMLTERVALTAAHCVDEGPITPERVKEFGVVSWGPDVATPRQTARILGVHPHPLYASGGGPPTHDIAVLEVEPAAHTTTLWIDPASLTDEALSGPFLALGYGFNQSGTSGTRLAGRVTIDAVDSEFLYSDSATNIADASICNGDSGGPLYRELPDGRLLQVGVHSWGDNDCQGLAAATSVAVFADFVLDHVTRIHGTDDTCAARGAHDDAFCDPECPGDPICTVLEPAAASGCTSARIPVGALPALVRR